jgi:hypothetical protein
MRQLMRKGMSLLGIRGGGLPRGDVPQSPDSTAPLPG